MELPRDVTQWREAVAERMERGPRLSASRSDRSVSSNLVIETILTAIAPVMLTALIGYFWTRSGRSIEAQGLTQIVTEIGTPCLVFSTFAKMSVPAGAFAATAAASLTILIGFLIVATLVLKLCGLSLRTYLPSMAFPNTGNLGIPLALYAFGAEGLAYAIVFLCFTSVMNFTIGQAIAAGTMSWRAIIKMPIIYAVALGLVVTELGIVLPQSRATRSACSAASPCR